MAGFPIRRLSLSASEGKRRASRWALRIGLVVASPLLALGLTEIGLRVAHVGQDTAFFIADERPGYFRPNPAFTHLFFPAQFDLKPLDFRLTRHKPPGGVRVFVLGESAVFGTPEPGFGFVEQLRAQLRARHPGRPVEVFNLGITAINSHVIVQIARSAADFEPDVFVVYMGNNEVVGPYGPASVSLDRTPPLAVIRASIWLRQLRLGQLIARVIGSFGGDRGRAAEWQGMRTFANNVVRGDDPRLEAVYRNFQANLEDIVAIASRAGAKVVLSTVVANLQDSAPFVSLHRPGLPATQAQVWQAAFDAGRQAWKLGDVPAALEQLEQARSLDPQYADGHFLLGRIEAARGRESEARAHFVDALRWDALRFRPDPRINDTIRAVARRSGETVSLVDAALDLGSDPRSVVPPAGHAWLFEHVHFNWEGNYRMARLLAARCASVLALPGRGADWLTSDECAAALGYTDYGRLTSLFGIRDLTKVPPFTNQITFGDDQSRLGREISLVSARLAPAGALDAAAARVETAIAADPTNPFLPLRLEEIEFQRGNHARALALLDQTAALQPASPELAVKKATILRLLKRYTEAEDLLRATLASDPHFLPAVQALGEVWAETAQFETGREFLAQRLARTPDNRYLRLVLADLLLRGGDRAGAERECRRVLQADPSDEGALARLTQLCLQTGRRDEALELMLSAYRSQPKNFANNARLAQLFEAQDDAGRAAEFMQAMTESGPTNAALRLRLAQRLEQLHRPVEMRIQLRRARQQAAAEGNAAVAREVEAMLRRVGDADTSSAAGLFSPSP